MSNSSNNYWRHEKYRVRADEKHCDEKSALSFDWNDTNSVAKTEPRVPTTTESAGGYWVGDYRASSSLAVQKTQEKNTAHRSGSVSAQARRAYAAEALRQKDHVAAGLLAIFLGVLGVHKFYLGCNQAGFAMMSVSIIGGIFTFGLAAAVIEVIALIEGVIYLFKKQTAFDQTYVLNQRDWF